MASIYQLKPAFQNLLRPFVTWLNQKRVTANQVTVTTLVISLLLAGGLFLFEYHTTTAHFSFLLIPLWMLIRMAFNAVDGMLAREFDQQTTLGAFLNELCDVIADTALYIVLGLFSAVCLPLLFIVIFFSILSEYTGVMAPLVGHTRGYQGPMGKSDRAFWFSLLTIICIVTHSFSFSYLVVNSLLIFILIGLFKTIFNRIQQCI